MTADGRTCTVSGLHLLRVGPDTAFHVGKTTYPQPSAASRTADVHRQDWGRWDTLGATYYVAGAPEIAYAEVLAVFKLPNGAPDLLAEIADQFGITRDEAAAYIAEDWGYLEKDFQGIGAIPSAWRTSRRLYEVQLQDHGWVVDMQHPDTIAALEAAGDGMLSRWLGLQGIPALTLSTLTSENRTVTTEIADVLRGTTLDDGSTPAGVHFPSKHGMSWCRALWLPPADALQHAWIDVVKSHPISVDDPDLQTVARRFRLTVA